MQWVLLYLQCCIKIFLFLLPQNIFITPKGNHMPHNLPSPHPLETTHLLSFSVNSSIPDILYKQNQTTPCIFCTSGLASFTQRDVFNIHLCYSMCRDSTPLSGCRTCQSVGCVLFMHSSGDGRVGCCQSLAIIKKYCCTLSIPVQVFV